MSNIRKLIIGSMIFFGSQALGQDIGSSQGAAIEQTQIDRMLNRISQQLGTREHDGEGGEAPHRAQKEELWITLPEKIADADFFHTIELYPQSYNGPFRSGNFSFETVREAVIPNFEEPTKFQTCGHGCTRKFNVLWIHVRGNQLKYLRIEKIKDTIDLNDYDAVEVYLGMGFPTKDNTIDQGKIVTGYTVTHHKPFGKNGHQYKTDEFVLLSRMHQSQFIEKLTRKVKYAVDVHNFYSNIMSYGIDYFQIGSFDPNDKRPVLTPNLFFEELGPEIELKRNQLNADLGIREYNRSALPSNHRAYYYLSSWKIPPSSSHAGFFDSMQSELRHLDREQLEISGIYRGIHHQTSYIGESPYLFGYDEIKKLQTQAAKVSRWDPKYNEYIEAIEAILDRYEYVRYLKGSFKKEASNSEKEAIESVLKWLEEYR